MTGCDKYRRRVWREAKDVVITLVIMAAGLGSRFQGGIKQLEPIGQNGEIIMDYSIHDAIDAGFTKIVIVIRKAIEHAFYDRVGGRIQEYCSKNGIELRYAYQESDDVPVGFGSKLPRMKPWGTGHAVLACREMLREPFAVINADDYYGKESFKKIACFLKKWQGNSMALCMVGYKLKNTLSEHGGVTRGICKIDGQGKLQRITEVRNIVMSDDGPQAAGGMLDRESIVSMNMWGMPAAILPVLESKFLSFLAENGDDPEKEFLLPEIIDELVSAQEADVTVLPTDDKCFGMTYREDLELVRAKVLNLHNRDDATR